MATSKTDYKGSFSWKIEDQSQVRAFLNAKPSKHFSSEIFKIGGLEWQLYAYPSGKYPIPKYSNREVIYPQEGCELHLKLLPKSWPRNVNKIIFTYRLFCSAANSSFTNLQIFSKNRDNRYFVRWFRGTLTTKELLALEGQIVNLECYINILKMESRNKQIIYQYPYPTNSLKKIYEFEWKINNIQQLFVDTRCGKHLESDIFNDFWCLRIAPRGWKLHEQKYVTAWLQLCALPMNIFKMYCQYTIKCKELNISYSGKKYFSYIYKGTNAPWNQKALITDSLKKLKGNTLTFQCHIVILNKTSDRNYNRNYNPAIQYQNINGAQYKNSNGAQYKKKGFIGNVNNQSVKQIQADNKINSGDHKSSEIDELRQENIQIRKQMAAMQQTINNLQLTVATIMQNMNTNDDALENKMDGLVDGPGFDMNEKIKPIEVWLRYGVKLPKYIEVFKSNGVEMDLIKSGILDSDDLKELGVDKCDREKMMKAITKLVDMNEHEHTMNQGGENMNDSPCKKPTPFI